jgi:parallel beta-helix repeat protein
MISQVYSFSVIAFLIFCSYTIGHAEIPLSVSNITITDVSHSNFSVVWLANQPSKGSLLVFSDPEAQNSLNDLTITSESASHPLAESYGILKVSVGSDNIILPDTTYYFKLVTTTIDGNTQYVSDDIYEVRTEHQINLVNNNMILQRILKPGGLDYADGTLLLAYVKNSSTPLTAWVGDGYPSPYAAIDLSNLFNTETHESYEISTGKEITLCALGGTLGAFTSTALIDESYETQIITPDAELIPTDNHRIINVPEAFETIQSAIDSSQDGDIVLLQPGTYYEAINFQGKNITVGSFFVTTGNPAYITQTIIDGKSADTSVVTINSGEEASAKLSGLTLINGKGQIKSSGWEPYIYGGGIFCENSSPSLSHLIISNNSLSGSAAYGAGIYCVNANPTITNVRLSDNAISSSQGFGGAIFCSNTELKLVNVTIANNQASFGGGIYCADNSRVSINNTILWHNMPQQLFFKEIGEASAITITYSDIQGGKDSIVENDNVSVYWLDGNIDENPLFCSDYFIAENSSCLGAGLDNVTIGMHGQGCPVMDVPGYVWHVSITNGSDMDGNGTEDQPFMSIQKAIDQTSGGDTVIVHPGEYKENINYHGKSIIVTSLFQMSQDLDDISQTIINGMGNTTATFENNEGSGSILNGFTLINASKNRSAIYCSRSNPHFTHLTIMNGNGSGIHCISASPMIDHCLITGNKALSGGGIYCDNQSSPTIINSTLSTNTASQAGGGIYCRNSSTPKIINSIVWGNTPHEIYFSGYYAPNAVTIDHTNIRGGREGIPENNGVINWLDGNINGDPLFVDPQQNDYHIQPGSPCIDAGRIDDDYHNEPMPNGERINIGRYGNTVEATTTSTNTSNSLTIYIYPQAAAEAGAKWRIEGGEWRESGMTETRLSEEQYVIEFNEVEGWDKPDNMILESGNAFSIPTGSYVQSEPLPSVGMALDLDISSHSYENSISETDIETSINLETNKMFLVGVIIQGAKNTDTVQIEINYDADRLEFIEGDETMPEQGITNFMNQNGCESIGFNITERWPGKINVSAATIYSESEQAPVGSGILAILQFKTMDEEYNNNIYLSDGYLIDCNDNEIPLITTSNATINAYPQWDFNIDGVVNFRDLSLFANQWLMDENHVEWDETFNLNHKPDQFGKQIIDFRDLEIFADNWLKTVR